MRFADLKRPTLHATTEPGVYVRDIPIADALAMEGELEGKSAAEVLRYYFTHVLRDEHGEPFEITDAEIERIGLKDSRALVDAAMAALDLGGNDSSPTGVTN